MLFNDGKGSNIKTMLISFVMILLANEDWWWWWLKVVNMTMIGSGGNQETKQGEVGSSWGIGTS